MPVNWTNITGDFVGWSTQGYTTAMGFFFWPLFFTTIITYVYLKQRSATAAVAIILIVFAAFGNALLNVGPWVNLLYILVSLIFTSLVVYFIIKRRGIS